MTSFETYFQGTFFQDKPGKMCLFINLRVIIKEAHIFTELLYMALIERKISFKGVIVVIVIADFRQLSERGGSTIPFFDSDVDYHGRFGVDGGGRDLTDFVLVDTVLYPEMVLQRSLMLEGLVAAETLEPGPRPGVNHLVVALGIAQ